ncbi:MAG TPA: hypothetical protein VGV89_06135 [Thermoplasmata archaeon]|nr:hypothetical protein [Thermoplasmata archaeon]
MVRKKLGFLTDRVDLLRTSRSSLEEELHRLLREEEYLARQIRRAKEQLRYYDQLLVELKQSAGRAPPLRELARRFG